MSFKDKVVFITGSTGGVGKATAHLFAADGANLVLLGTRKERLQSLVKELGVTDENSLSIPVDISNENDVKFAVEAAVTRFGNIDILVNTAGIAGPAVLTEEYSFEDFRRVYEVNVFGTFLTMKYILPIMKKQGHGAIVNTASISGMGGYAYEVGYGSSKWAVIGLTKDAASENANNGIRINSISPGWIETKMMKEILDNYVATGVLDKPKDFDPGPMGRPGKTMEMANVIYFLASDKASYVNGANYVVDGGATIG
ncbi:MAG: SDR family NAD(P)-dependent oxidoreductase [Syntrophomonadaceae bacterium]|nr:SDR family NAD(P)-dependent oxidoreductase [Syntrophomonadaceae bacterium]MDD3889950.1 SDR family NAD(P)-dependent oxidoreductase [Syntrophomonadaceae bacterium]MDD4549229.1 SDR family NAD(P)-dependent oxidoreductase [Syntrophomonadaceae bacterium]